MKLDPFRLERFQSTWEHLVKYNLAESGVHPITLEELFKQIKIKSKNFPYIMFRQTEALTSGETLQGSTREPMKTAYL
jgi:hypothetical protein